jgi:8-oxo-dGTP pyrophosphatase MutT (NUDIX family)
LKKYVQGFMFNFQSVALIRKARPAWQAGLWNGIGGKVEPGEYSNHAMYREFLEEAGVNTPIDAWKLYCRLHGNDADGPFIVDCYKYRVVQTPAIRTMTDEPVSWHHLDTLPRIQTIPNLRWLIPYALYADNAKFVMDFNYDFNRKGDY